MRNRLFLKVTTWVLFSHQITKSIKGSRNIVGLKNSENKQTSIPLISNFQLQYEKVLTPLTM